MRLFLPLLVAITLPFVSAAQTPAHRQAPRIQVALLLDVSYTMEGLLEQAKTQLWSMARLLARAECEGGHPRVEIALYEYGRSSNDQAAGYVRRLCPFTTDLDKLSGILQGLNTGGGNEYCGEVIHAAVKDLDWDPSPTSYKVIFIAGNESFRQGPYSYQKSCAEAGAGNIIVNTIYCGFRAQAYDEFWDLGASCGGGSFTCINTDADPEIPETPYDNALITLNKKWHFETDPGAASLPSSDIGLSDTPDTISAERIATANAIESYNLYTPPTTTARNNAGPAHSGTSSRTEIQVRSGTKKEAAAQKKIRQRISALSQQRDRWLAAQQQKKASSSGTSLKAEIARILVAQGRRHGFRFQ